MSMLNYTKPAQFS